MTRFMLNKRDDDESSMLMFRTTKRIPEFLLAEPGKVDVMLFTVGQ